MISKPLNIIAWELPEISLRDMFDDAFTPVAHYNGQVLSKYQCGCRRHLSRWRRDGLNYLRVVAIRHARSKRARAENALVAPEDLEVLRKAAELADSAPPVCELSIYNEYFYYGN